MEYRSTEEGALIQFHCDKGYTPSHRNTSQCINTTWSPDPQLLHCMSELSGGLVPDIDPSLNILCVTVWGVIVCLTSHTIFLCIYSTHNTILFIVQFELIIKTLLSCDLEGCGYPNVSTNDHVVVNTSGTVYGISATYQCVDGLLPSEVFTIVCKSGSWSPDPNLHQCREPGMLLCTTVPLA